MRKRLVLIRIETRIQKFFERYSRELKSHDS